MLPTPTTSHVNYDRIYEPAEDSFLFLDTLSSASETAFLKARFSDSPNSPSPVLCEIGPGSGVILAFATAHSQHIFGRPDILALGVDANEYACTATAQTVGLATAEIEEYGNTPGVLGDCVVGDLTTCLKPGSVDVLLFNPPYVPTEALPPTTTSPSASPSVPSSSSVYDRDSHLLSLSYAGGVDGMEITNRFLTQVPDVLSERGVCYLLLCAQNRPAEVMERIRRWPVSRGASRGGSHGGWLAETVGSSGKKAGWEKLVVVRIWRP